MSSVKIPNTITLVASLKGGMWTVTSPDAPGVIGESGIQAGTRNSTGFDQAITQFKRDYIDQAGNSVFGGKKGLRAALGQPAITTRFLDDGRIEMVLRTEIEEGG